VRSTKLPLWTERLLGLEPVPPPPHVFSLDERALRYGCFHGGPQGFVYEASHALEVPAGILADGPLGAPMAKPEAFSSLVDELVRQLAGPIKGASLVLPDNWLRLTFTEISELPRRRQAREDVLRWKLKRLVPFRVEDLRVSATQVTPFPGQELPVRLLLGFAIELLLSQIEDAFAAAGVELGRIVNTTLALAASVEHTVEARDLAGLVAVFPDAYTLSFFRRGELLLYRYKASMDSGAGSAANDLRLTDSFLRQHFPQTPVSRVFLAAPEQQEERWQEWISNEVGARPEPLAFEHFALSRTQVGPTWMETAPLLGAASLEVA
jgi:type IV pilus assembly protein PilM